MTSYRAADCKGAIAALEKTIPIDGGQVNTSNIRGCFFLAMAHSKLGNAKQAHQWHERARAWVDKNRYVLERLQALDQVERFRLEAEEVLGLPPSVPEQRPPDESPRKENDRGRP